VIHIDKCSVHISQASTSWLEEQGIGRMSYLPYSPDLAFSDFCLFLTVKEKLERIQVREEDQLFEFSQEIIKVINHDELNHFFQA
jgi:hypothetical protein